MNKISLFILIAAVLPVSHVVAQANIGTGAARKLYKEYCATCHGDKMQGGMGSSLVDDQWQHGSDDVSIAQVIAEGLPQAGMPGWSEKLNDRQIRSLVILIREQRSMTQTESSVSKIDGVFDTVDYAFKLEKIGAGTGVLWSLDVMPDGGILVTQKDGILWRFKEGKRFGPITGIPKVLNEGQGGLLEVQLHPNYKKNKWVYLSYSEKSRKGAMTAVVRGKIKKDEWVQQQEIFHVPEDLHIDTRHHFGSRFVFKDDYLFFSIGDRGRMEMAQDITRPNGKIHRIYDDGRIPEDNPFYKNKNAFRSIWSYGNRNPQGLDKHPVTGELWESEHGPRGGDEINVIEKGKNYGWPVITYGMNYDGSPITAKTEQPGMEQPKHYWTPSIAVAGIDFYHGKKFPKWKNNLFVSGLRSEQLHRLTIVDNKVTGDEIVLQGQGRVRDVHSGPDGYLYVILSSGSPEIGNVYRMVPVQQQKN